jgi:outer membrane lipoprotein-sorting protein
MQKRQPRVCGTLLLASLLTLLVFTSAFILRAHITSAAPTPPDLPTVLQRYDDLYRTSASKSTFVIHVVRQDQPMRTLELRAWTKGTEKSLIRIDAPEREAGTATLRIGSDMWNYLPRVGKTIRVPPSAMLGSWMGSDFTNDDLVKESSLKNDFDARYDGRSDTPAGWRIQLTAREGVVGLWNRIQLIVNDDGTLPLEAQYFDRNDLLTRTMTFDDVKTFGKHTIPTHIVIVPADGTGKRTGINYKDITFDADIPDDTFTLDNLEHVQ